MQLIKKLSALVLLLGVFLSAAKAKEEIPAEFQRVQPPGQVRAIILDDPAHKMVIGWNNYISFDHESTIYYDTKDHGLDITKYAKSQKADASWIFRAMSNQFAVLQNLKPDTKYYFVIKNGEGLSKRYYFQTLPNDPNVRLSIIAGGDSRNNRDTRRRANSLVRKLRPHFVMFGGDMTMLSMAHEWIGWFNDWQETIGEDGRVTPIAVARGNHERSNSIIELLFYTKKGVYYAFNVGGDLLRVYTLNSEITAGGAQADWLEQDLRDNEDVTWKFAQYHRPMRPHVGGKKDQAGSYKYWAPLFYQYGVNLVVESDAHTVKTTWPIRPEVKGDNGFVVDQLMGTVYVGEGCWGAPLRKPNDPKSWTRDTGMFNQVNWIWVSKEKVEVRKIKVDNAEAVGSLSDSNRFSMPENIDIWKPKNGEVVTLSPRSLLSQKVKAQNAKVTKAEN